MPARYSRRGEQEGNQKTMSENLMHEINVQRDERQRTSPASAPAKLSNPVADVLLDKSFQDFVDKRAEVVSCAEEDKEAAAKTRRINDLWSRSNVGRRFRSVRLDTYDTPTPEHRAALDACRIACSSFDHGDGLLLLGEPGGGKTHLLAAMLRVAVEAGRSVHILTAEEFFLGLRACMDEGRSESRYLSGLAGVDVLALDDLYCLAASRGGNEESYQYRMLWHLLDRRYADARPTLASTNRDLKEFREMIDERTRRRLEAKIVLVPRRQ